MIQKVELLTVENQHFQQQINNKENEIKQKNIEIEKLKEVIQFILLLISSSQTLYSREIFPHFFCFPFFASLMNH